jgi:hypothetical protein
MTDLSRAAQAVMNACTDAPIHINWATRFTAAAALRAVADQVVPEEPLYGGDQRWEWERDARQSSRKKMLAIADELEGIN